MQRLCIATLLALACEAEVPVALDAGTPPPPDAGDCPLYVCNGVCTNIYSDPKNCGECGIVCPAAANAQPTCQNFLCGITCADGFGDCDHDSSNGCETDFASSAANCGACGHDCIETSCQSGLCPSRLLVSGQEDPYALAAFGDHVYWLARASGALRRAPKDGGSIEELASLGALPNALVIAGGDAYVTTADAVVAVPAAGGPMRVVAANRPGPLGIATDGSSIYWTESGPIANQGRIMYAPVAGGPATTVTEGEVGPSSVAVRAGLLYWTTLDGRIRFLPSPGMQPLTLASAQPEPDSISVDAEGVYWISRGNYTNGQPIGNGLVCETSATDSTMVLTLPRLWPGGLAVEAPQLYFSNRADGTVVRVAFRRNEYPYWGLPLLLAAHQPAPYAVALDQQFVYFTDRAAGTIKRVAK